MPFWKRVTELREERNLTIPQMSKSVKISYAAYLRYEAGLQEPLIEYFWKLSDFFDVSMDYLAGRTDNREYEKTDAKTSEILLSERLLILRQIRNISHYVIEEETEITRFCYRRYERGEREPKMKNLLKLADYFDVSIDYLVGRTDKPEINI